MPIPGDPVARVRGITKGYSNGRRSTPVLHGLDLTISRHEITAITGPSGSGKTTLLRVLGGLSKPDRGTVTLHGEDLYALADRRRSRLRNETVGFVFQDYRLLPTYNAIENVMLPLLIAGIGRREQRRRARHALAQVGLQGLADQRVDRLSGGQEQRVGIARALAMRPRLLIADEPTGNLDRRAGAGIMALFQTLRSRDGISVVLVTHDEQLAGQGDHLIRLVDGRIVTDCRLDDAPRVHQEQRASL